ncbi:DUF6292 family protein (plasmid) [Embleya sp. NBC_00888]|uniref:DUF6292 family protein n=1 Tax=Embleya sp. NBC_00888 TaxID=2975960 RepID=UPI0038677879|nr:DUF6292 family protein [Embleya sp. NBC_00888]
MTDDRALGNLIGHYMAAVAERLLADGHHVVGCDAHPPHTDDNELPCARGWIGFAHTFQQTLHPGPYESELTWDIESGWSCSVWDTATSEPVLPLNRWAGAGPVPAPERVAAFVAALLLDAAAAGTSKRPAYSGNLRAAHTRLRAHLPRHTRQSWAQRVDAARRHANRRHALEYLAGAHAEEPPLYIPVLRVELRTLSRWLEDAEAASDLPGELVRLLAQDLVHRAATTADARAVRRHATAREHAGREIARRRNT